MRVLTLVRADAGAVAGGSVRRVSRPRNSARDRRFSLEPPPPRDVSWWKKSKIKFPKRYTKWHVVWNKYSNTSKELNLLYPKVKKKKKKNSPVETASMPQVFQSFEVSLDWRPAFPTRMFSRRQLTSDWRTDGNPRSTKPASAPPPPRHAPIMAQLKPRPLTLPFYSFIYQII